MTILLAIETATEACSVALWQDGVAKEIFEIAPRRHSELVLSFIDRLLKDSYISLADVDAFAFGAGPGSFMGVRIATAVAQSLAFAQQKPVIPISTLQILAQTAYRELLISEMLVAWDARMDEIYWGGYCLNKDCHMMQSVIPDQLSKPAEMNLSSLLKTPLPAVGNAWHIYQDFFHQDVLKFCHRQESLIYPHAIAAVEIAAFLYSQTKVSDPLSVQPIYIRNQVAKESVKN